MAASSRMTMSSRTLGAPRTRGLQAPSQPKLFASRPRATVCKPVCVGNVDEASFASEVLQADRAVLVDFWATWCGPCKLVAPLMDWVEKEHGSAVKVVKIEHDKNPGLIEKYKVYGLPTLILFKDGQEIAGSKREGAVTKPMLLDYLKKNGIVA